MITPSTAFGKDSVASLLHERYGESCSFINLNYEQFISSWKGTYKSSQSAVCKNRQIQCVWGEYYREILVENGFNEKNIYITGRPHLEYLKNKQEHFRDRKSMLLRLGLEPLNKIIFIALTDGLAFASDEKIEYIVKSGSIKEELLQSISYVKQGLAELFQQVVDYQGADVTFVLRPHPSVSERRYEELLCSMADDGNIPAHIKVTKEYDAYTWLMLCDVFVTNYSTLCIEAGVMGVSTFAFQIPGQELGKELWNMNSVSRCRSLRKIFDAKPSDFVSDDYYVDVKKNGLSGTTDVILNQLDLAAESVEPERAKIIFRRRILGSLLRRCVVRFPIIMSFMPRTLGLARDYFTEDQIRRKLMNVESL